ncbi:fibroblast growth factor receptor 3-like [Branchiostoma floridae]|uniref:receptor protein-tyrosine kinase n=1 Tax=Branchiostoma floridae TaxID=7739 RepID=A0A9J7N2Y8_BRAFL|nr:fibroblast growth factor receptor 3-like [Branchiostoma floridae]
MSFGNVPGSALLLFLAGVSTLTVSSGEPRFTSVPGNIVATIGEDVVFYWDVTHEPEQTMLFIAYSTIDAGSIMYGRNDDFTVLPQYEGRVERVGQVGLRLRHVKASDSGTYKLHILFLNDVELENTASLDVRYPPTGTFIRVDLSQKTRKEENVNRFKVAAKKGTVLKLTCVTDSNPPAEFSWIKPTGDISAVNKTSGVLVIPNVRENDAGLYNCRARNGIQPDGIASINVTVQNPPTMTTTYIVSPRREIRKGDEVRIGCRVGDARPLPQFQWTRSDSKTEELPDTAVVDEETGLLTIASVKLEDAGVYRCVADNNVKPAGFALIMLNVSAEPLIGPVVNSTRRSGEWILPLAVSLPSVGFCLVCIAVLVKLHVRAKSSECPRQRNELDEEEPSENDPIMYLSPDPSVILLSAATEEDQTMNPILQEFWDCLIKMDADPVLVYFQKDQVLSADHTAVIRSAPFVVNKLLRTINILEGDKTPHVLSKALRHTEQNHLADLLEGKVLPDAKCLSVFNATDSTFSIRFKPAYTNIQHFGDVDKYAVTLEIAVLETETIATRILSASDNLQAEFTNLASGTSYNVTVVCVRGETRSAGVTITVTTIGGYEEPSSLLTTFSEQKRSQISQVLIYKDKITLMEALGKGNFGEVRYGVYVTQDRCVPCAVKTLFDTASFPEMKSLLWEGLRMVNFKHDNVLQLIGMCVHGNEAMIVLPYMKNGDLHKYLRDKQTLPLEDNLRLCLEIAHGMAYLAAQEIVHRDLAARNCMLDHKMQVKVADFGLCRDVHEKGYYRIQNWEKCHGYLPSLQVKLPYKWMAPESHEEYIFDTKTDVWSYGIVLWEIFSGGKTPYPDVPSAHFISYLREGHRMSRPNRCPIRLYNDVVKQCWQKDPTKRPSFKEILARAEQISKTVKQRQEADDVSVMQQRSPSDSHFQHSNRNSDPENMPDPGSGPCPDLAPCPNIGPGPNPNPNPGPRPNLCPGPNSNLGHDPGPNPSLCPDPYPEPCPGPNPNPGYNPNHDLKPNPSYCPSPVDPGPAVDRPWPWRWRWS